MKRLNRIAKRITAFDEAVEKFIKECEDDGRFDNDQLNEIRWGFEYNLSLDQVKVYADLKFNADQMWQIRYGFMDGLTMEEVKLYANPRFDEYQMEEAREDLENGLTIEEVKEKYGL